jgi:hypothetical protein
LGQYIPTHTEPRTMAPLIPLLPVPFYKLHLWSSSVLGFQHLMPPQLSHPRSSTLPLKRNSLTTTHKTCLLTPLVNCCGAIHRQVVALPARSLRHVMPLFSPQRSMESGWTLETQRTVNHPPPEPSPVVRVNKYNKDDCWPYPMVSPARGVSR